MTVSPLTPAHCPTANPGHAKGTVLVVGGGGIQGRTAVTLEGEKWVDVTTETNGPTIPGHTRNLIRNVGYGAGMFVAVGGYDNAYVSTSCDGVNWRQDVLGTNVDSAPAAPFNAFLSAVAYKDGVFVAAGGNGRRLVSNDYTLSWKAEGGNYGGHFRAIAAGNGVFVAVGHDYGLQNGAVSVSSNGSQWSPVASSPGALWHVAFGNGTFVAAGETRCVRSADGNNWENCNHGINGNHSGVQFINGQFYLSLSNGWTRSVDGKTWDPPQSTTFPERAAFGNGRYVMARWGKRGYSLDLKTWTELPFDTSWGLRGLVAGEVLFGN
jgi:hypothetical protein